MDAKEIFKQLTCGVIFTKPIASKSQVVKNNHRMQTNWQSKFFYIQKNTATSTCIKKEIKDENVSIKSEDESDNEGTNSEIQILSDSAMPILMSKKKKKVTPEQLQNWETEKVCDDECLDLLNNVDLHSALSISDKSFTKQVPHSREGI